MHFIPTRAPSPLKCISIFTVWHITLLSAEVTMMRQRQGFARFCRCLSSSLSLSCNSPSSLLGQTKLRIYYRSVLKTQRCLTSRFLVFIAVLLCALFLLLFGFCTAIDNWKWQSHVDPGENRSFKRHYHLESNAFTRTFFKAADMTCKESTCSLCSQMIVFKHTEIQREIYSFSFLLPSQPFLHRLSASWFGFSVGREKKMFTVIVLSAFCTSNEITSDL